MVAAAGTSHRARKEGNQILAWIPAGPLGRFDAAPTHLTRLVSCLCACIGIYGHRYAAGGWCWYTGLCADTPPSSVPSTQVICKGFGAGTEPKNIAVDEADMSLYDDNEQFDMDKFLKAIADPRHWVVSNLQRRFAALCAMLAIVSAEREPTGLVVVIFSRELDAALEPVMRRLFTRNPNAPALFTLNHTGGSVPGVKCTRHMSAGRP